MIEIKGEAGESLLIGIEGRLYPKATDAIDTDFLKGYIKASVSGFNAHFPFVTTLTEISHWVILLQGLSEYNNKEVLIATLEEHLSIRLGVTELGKVQWNIELLYPSGEGSQLFFRLENGISDIDRFINELHIVINTMR